MALGKKHEVSVSLENYLHCIIGDKKIGKSSLIVNIAEELYGSIERVLMLSLRNEKAHEAINGAVFEEPQTWKELMDITKEFVKGGHDFKMLSFDTIDELIEMAQEEVIRLHTVKYKEVPKSFNASFGGFGEPRKQLMKLINELLDLIKDTGYGYYFVGHNKVKTVKSKLDEEDYTVIGSNLSADYFNAIAYKCPIICNIVSETEKSSNGLLTDKIRYMHFRDNAYIEAGSRFSEMPVKVPYGAKEYVDAVVGGIKASIEVERKTPPTTEPKKTETKAKVETKTKAKSKVEEPPVVEEPKATEVETQSVEEALQSLEVDASPAEILELIRGEFGRLQKSGMKQNEILNMMEAVGCRMPKKDTDPAMLQTLLSALRSK